MVEDPFPRPRINVKTEELKVVDLAKGQVPTRHYSTTMSEVRTVTPVLDWSWECPFCKAVVYETKTCECGAVLRLQAERDVT